MIADVPLASLEKLLGRFDLTLVVQEPDEPIIGSFWGDSEAGIVGHRVYVREDTPIHSLLHETCHTLCMTTERREQLDRDAGGDDLEEAAVCYLQVVLADQLQGVGREQLINDMDTWGYSFRFGDTASWFDRDADDAREWLATNELLDQGGFPTFRLRA